MIVASCYLAVFKTLSRNKDIIAITRAMMEEYKIEFIPHLNEKELVIVWALEPLVFIDR